MYILICIVIFGILIAVHEFGHFIVAKACNVKVNEFSIGMGPQLLHRQKGETVYSLRLFPVGGFCAMEGEDGDSEDDRSFSRAPAWKRFFILIAGSVFNFLTGLIVVMILFSSIQNVTSPVISGFMDGFPLESQEYFQKGDEFVSIEGKRVLLTGDISTILSVFPSDTVDVTLRRDGQLRTLKDVPLVLREYETEEGTVWRYGFYFEVREATVADRIQTGFFNAVNFVREVFWSFEMLLTGSAGMKDLTGPIGIVNTMSEVGQSAPTTAVAATNILYFSAFIAVNLAVMNLLPIPALDGGRVFFLILNSLAYLLFKKRIPEKLEGMVHFAGLVLLLALMAVVAVQDVLRVIG